MSETGSGIPAGVTALQDIELTEAELDAIWPAVEQNVATASRLAGRIAFEDEPAAYVRVTERMKG